MPPMQGSYGDSELHCSRYGRASRTVSGDEEGGKRVMEKWQREINQSMHRARAAGLTFLNEMGLDPGIDHLEAMRIINEVKAKNGKVYKKTKRKKPKRDIVYSTNSYTTSLSVNIIIRLKHLFRGAVDYQRQVLQTSFINLY